MPNNERIETLISPEALKQFEQLKIAADANVSSFEKLVAKAVELNKNLSNATSFKEVAKATKELEQNDQELISAQVEVAKSNERLKKANKDLGDSFANVGNKITVITGTAEDAFGKLLKLNDALRANKKAQQDLLQQKSSLAQMNKEIPEVARSLEHLIQREKELKQEEFLLKKSVSDTNKEIKQRLNLAIVTPGTREEIKETISGLTRLRDTKIDINTDEGRAQIAEINQEIDRLNKVMEQTTDKLAKRKINIGNYPGAAKILEQSLNQVNKSIDDFTKSGHQNEEMLKALTNEQQLLQTLVDAQSEGFKSATAAIKGNEIAIQALTQVYGEDSEVVQNLIKETAELKDQVGDLKAQIKAQASDTKVFDGLIDAAQTLAGVYGIAQGAAALFGDENEELQKTFVKLQAVQAILAGLQGIQNALQKESAVRILITNGLEKVKLFQKNLETAAESKNIIVKYAAIAAQKALNIATSAAGGPILILIALLATAFASMAAYGDGVEDAAKKNERLNRSLERSNTAIDNSSNIIKAKGEKDIAQLEENFAAEGKLREQKEKNANAELENLKRFNQLDAKNRQDAINEVKRLTSGKQKQDKEAIENAIKTRDAYLANLDRETEMENKIELLRLQNSRETKEEAIKARQDEVDAQKTQIQTALQLQQNAANNERKTQKDRVAALQEAQSLQEKLINKDAQKQLLNPTLTASEVKVIEANRTAALIQSRRDSNKAIEELNRAYAEREKKARFDIVKTQIEDQIKASDLIAQTETNNFDKRTDALYAAFEKRRAIVIAQHDFDIQNDTLTAIERTAIEKKYLSDINQLTVDYGMQQRDLYQQNQDAVNAILEKNQQGRLDKISSQQSLELIALTESFRNGNISVEEYARERANIEQRYRIISLKEEVNNATAKVLATKEGTAERYAAEKELAEKTLALNDEVTAKQIEAQQKLADAKKQLTAESFDLINQLQGNAFDRESQVIQSQIEEIDRKKEREIESANATITNAQDRATAIAKIEAKAQQQKEDLERRQRQVELERARFEKAANIAQIIASTAAAVIETLKTYKGTPQAFALATAVGAIGAVQLAKAIATPLPKFAEGTTDAPGGLSWVGDAYRKELVITPDGNMFQTPSVPTVMNVPKHSIVLPDARAALESGLAVNQYGRLIQTQGESMHDVGRKIDTLTKVMKNKPVLNMSADQGGLTAIWKYGANWVQYVEDQTKF